MEMDEEIKKSYEFFEKENSLIHSLKKELLTYSKKCFDLVDHIHCGSHTDYNPVFTHRYRVIHKYDSLREIQSLKNGKNIEFNITFDYVTTLALNKIIGYMDDRTYRIDVCIMNPVYRECNIYFWDGVLKTGNLRKTLVEEDLLTHFLLTNFIKFRINII